MQKLLVAGIDSVVGANLAAELAGRFHVVGLSFSEPISIADCSTATCPVQDAESVNGWIASERPDWVVLCGPAAHSSWCLNGSGDPGNDAIEAVRHWARAAESAGCEFTLVSSDGVFRGPWMFHDEASERFCDSGSARTIRAIEVEATDLCRATLIVRTNVFGWSPSMTTPGFVEPIIQSLEAGETRVLDCIRHATPILANDLAEILEQAFHQQLRGVYHAPGAERTNPFAFARHLAERFGHSDVLLDADDWRTRGGRAFGDGETSLRSTNIRQALGIAPPMLGEGIDRLYEQMLNGYRERFEAAQTLVHEKVA